MYPCGAVTALLEYLDLAAKLHKISKGIVCHVLFSTAKLQLIAAISLRGVVMEYTGR